MSRHGSYRIPSQHLQTGVGGYFVFMFLKNNVAGVTIIKQAACRKKISQCHSIFFIIKMPSIHLPKAAVVLTEMKTGWRVTNDQVPCA